MKHHTWINSLLITLLMTTFFSIVTIVYGESDHGHNHDQHGHEEASDEHEQKGLHGGKLLIDGDISVELVIYELGESPEYHAWIYHDGSLITDQDIQLTVELKRLDDQLNQFNFIRKNDYWLGKGTVEEPHSFDVTVTLNVHDEKHTWAYESYEGRVTIDPTLAKQAGIQSIKASEKQINRTITVYGKIVVDPTQRSEIRARFPGLIINVNANIGDAVNQGDILASIEYNESLQRYSIKSPLTGTVISRNANPGEFANEQVLFTVANHEKLWVEFRVFPNNVKSIALDQTIVLNTKDQNTVSSIKHLIPNNTDYPYILARAPIDNKMNNWIPGMMVEGKIIINQASARLAVDNRALQSFRDWTVVFIQIGNTYEIRPLELGQTDGKFTEVIHGLNIGDRYVVENSYLIKADIEKSSASHDH